MVEDLVRIVRNQQRNGYAPKNASSFLESLHHEQNEPTLLFANLSFPIKSSGDNGSIFSKTSRDPLPPMSDSAANHNGELANAFETFEDEMCLHSEIPESTTHDEELDAIDKESRKLRAKLKMLEAKKVARTHQLQKRPVAFDDAYYYGPDEVEGSVGHEQKESGRNKAYDHTVILQALEKNNSWTTTFLENNDYVVV